jgi:predicted transcriptional regulator
MAKLNHQQQMIVDTIAAHAEGGGEALAVTHLDREVNSRHNRWLGYDRLHSALRRLEKRGLVRHDKHRPSRWSLTAAGKKLVTPNP